MEGTTEFTAELELMDMRYNKFVLVLAAAALLCGCNPTEEELLEPKVFFEESELRMEVDDQTSLTYDLQARVSNKVDKPVTVTYEFGDALMVDAYNAKNGTAYEALDVSKASFSKNLSYIFASQVYSTKVQVTVNDLSGIEDGKFYVLPIKITSSTLPVIEGIDVMYLVITKPVRITTVTNFTSSYIKVPIPAGRVYKSVTYEALINMSYMGSNNTIMGTEGVLILRIGDTALPDGHNDWLQIAGTKQYHSTNAFVTDTWYHVAFTYDQPSGLTALYINGVKAAESTWDTPEFASLGESAGGFFIGKVAGFMWGERPFYGSMSEVRLWSVARTENQIRQNMINVDPTSEGLDFYYKLNGTDQFKGEDNLWYVRDMSGNELHGLVNGGNYALNTSNLSTPVAIN